MLKKMVLLVTMVLSVRMMAADKGLTPQEAGQAYKTRLEEKGRHEAALQLLMAAQGGEGMTQEERELFSRLGLEGAGCASLALVLVPDPARGLLTVEGERSAIVDLDKQLALLQRVHGNGVASSK